MRRGSPTAPIAAGSAGPVEIVVRQHGDCTTHRSAHQVESRSRELILVVAAPRR